MLVIAPDREEAPATDEDAADLRKVLGTLTRSERAFCRSVAFRAVPMVAYRKAWPGWAARHGSKTIATNVAKLLERQPILSAIEHYRQQIGTAPKRLEWGKVKRAVQTDEKWKRLGIGLREVQTAVDHGTPELRRKMKSDVIMKLTFGGQLQKEHIEAAREIAAVIEAWQRGLSPGGWNLDGVPVDNRSSRYERAESTSPDFLDAWEKHFRPWIAEVGPEPIAAKNRDATLGELVYDVVVNNRGTSQIDKEYGMQHGRALDHLRDGLWRYAVIAGWARPEKDAKAE